MTLKTYTGGVAVYDRGSVRFVNDFDFAGVKRFYQVANHEQGFVRAWHGHHWEGKYVYVAQGSALVGAVNLDTQEVTKVVLSDQSPKVVYIPPNHANGFKNLSGDLIIQFFSTATLEESKGDDVRYPFDKWDIWQPDYR